MISKQFEYWLRRVASNEISFVFSSFSRWCTWNNNLLSLKLIFKKADFLVQWIIAALADPREGPGGRIPPPPSDLTLVWDCNFLHRQDRISLVNWLNVFKWNAHCTLLPTKLNWVPHQFASARKAVFVRCNRDWWEGVWGTSNLPRKSSTVLSESLDPPPPK